MITAGRRGLALCAALAVAGICMTACGSGESNATVCNNLSKDGQVAGNEADNTLSSISANGGKLTGVQAAPFHTLATILTNDASKASDSRLTAAADALSADFDKLADDISSDNVGAFEADASTLEADTKTFDTFCPTE